MALTEMFAQSAKRFGDRALADFRGRTFTYRMVAAEARRFAAGLQALGIVKGDRVGLFLPNVPTYLAAYFGVLMAGATVVNYSTLLSTAELQRQVADSGTRLMVTLDVPTLLQKAEDTLHDSSLERLVVARVAPQLPFWRGLGFRLFAREYIAPLPVGPGIHEWADVLSDRDLDPVAIDPVADIALLQYTGGTGGTLKAAMLSHQNLTANARQVASIEPHVHARNVIMGVLPLFHIFANGCVLNRTVLGGGTIALMPRFHAGAVLAAIPRAKVTLMPGIPAMFQAMLSHPDMKSTDFSSLFTCISGGDPLPAKLKNRFEKLSGAKLVGGYGLTEAAGVVSSNPLDGREQSGSIGHPLPGTDIRLLDSDDPTRDAKPHAAGELAIAGPQVMQGYWNPGAQSALTFIDKDGKRWLRTGDLATIDEDGYVRLVDRSSDMFAVGGLKVFPSRVEQVLADHPAVREAAVIGISVPGNGEVARAFVVIDADSGADAGAIAAWVNERVDPHERVDRVVVRASMPRTLLGKLNRKALSSQNPLP